MRYQVVKKEMKMQPGMVIAYPIAGYKALAK